MTNTQTDQADYIAGILSGNPVLVKEIYEKYHKAIIQLVETNKGTAEDAKDVFQEGLMLVYQKAKKPDFQLTSSFFTYFYAVCRNIWSNKMKKKSFGEVTLSDEMKSIVRDDTPQQLEQNEQYTLYRQKFLELGKDCQQLMSLFLNKISMKEIVEKMGLSSISYAKKKKFKCKEQLVKRIQSDVRYLELRH